MQEFGVTAGEDAVDLVILDPWLELGPQLGSEGKALLLAGEIHDVFAGVHHGRTTGWQFKGLSTVAGPGDRVFLFRFSGIQQATGAADELRKLTIQCRCCHGCGNPDGPLRLESSTVVGA